MIYFYFFHWPQYNTEMLAVESSLLKARYNHDDFFTSDQVPCR